MCLRPLLADRHADDPPIRVWAPGCATGEEAYSIAMLLLERFENDDPAQCVQVFGTDIDTEALKVAEPGPIRWHGREEAERIRSHGGATLL